MMPSYPRCGEIYLVKIPNKPDDGKRRPALIVSLDVRNKYANDVIAIPLTTNLRAGPANVLLKKSQGGLRKDSMARCDQITTLDKKLLLRGPFAGKIAKPILKQIHQAILKGLGVVE